MLRIFMRRGIWSHLIVASQKSWVFLPLRMAYPRRSIFTSVSLCQGARFSAVEQSRLSHSMVSNPSSLISRSEEHTSELQSRQYLVCRLLLEKKTYSIAMPQTPSYPSKPLSASISSTSPPNTSLPPPSHSLSPPQSPSSPASSVPVTFSLCPA